MRQTLTSAALITLLTSAGIAFPLIEAKIPVDQEPVELDQQQEQPTEIE
ncbi:hypothetical protein RCC94_04405 [Exiguobacterium acetylicum]|nr:hypothetical protein [Exiguobacterium acetylicum]MDQ6466714.1 hypothetical protein [Exiguobacterium acetylicum]